MDLERETYAHKSAEENELTTNQHGIANLDHNRDKVKVNGSYSKQNHDAGASVNVDSNTSPNDGQVNQGTGNEQVKSPLMGSFPLTKGFGLRKWRRIKRDVVKDASANADSSKVLKRGFSISGNPIKPTNLLSAEMKQNSEVSVGSAYVSRNGGVVDGLVAPGANLEARFAAAEDSENSEDRSSKSSTAASAPRLRYDLPTVLGYVREKNRIQNFGSSTQRVQQGKGRVESSKKPRGERVKIDKENSHSSMESDSRSSNFVLMQGACSVTTNGNPRDKSMYYDGVGAHAGDELFGEGQENVGEDEAGFQDNLTADASWEDKEEKSSNHHPSIDRDPLIESILTLRSAQQVLESEVQKLGEIGITASSAVADHGGVHESSSCEQSDSGNIRLSGSLESQVVSLRENIRYLENRLEEAKIMLKLKDSKVAELESSVISVKSAKNKNVEMQQEKCGVIESELEGIFKQKIEAEVEYLTLTKTIQKLRVAAAGDQMTLSGKQETSVGDKVQMLNNAGRKATMENGTEEVLKIQTRVCKVSSCLFMQLVLLILIFWSLALQLSPQSWVVVPT